MDIDQVTSIKHELREEGYNIYVYSYPGGMCFPRHSHTHDTIHIVLSGTVKIVIDGTEYFPKSGERFPISAGTVHSAEVLGDTPLICIDATRPK